MSSVEVTSSPEEESHSPGSSVSSRLQEQYDELLRYAVVTPQFDPRSFPPHTDKMRRSPLEQVDVMAKETDVLAEKRSEESMKSSDVNDESSHADNSSNEDSGSHIALPRPEHEQHERRQEVTFPLSGTPHSGTQLRVPPLVVDDSPPGSITDDNEDERKRADDPDMMRLELQLDSWTLDLKRNILAEFGQTRIKLLERHRQDVENEQERHAAELDRVHNELEGCKELLVTYEQSIARKDHIITNLSRALQKQKDKLELQKNFAAWKLRHCDEQREEFATKLARKHYDRHIAERVWSAWHGILETKWKQRVERACQTRAEEVCHRLSSEYEEKLSELNQCLQASQAEVAHLQAERQGYEETMKRAFMRGVCALNLEAMTMFREGTGSGDVEEGEEHEKHVGVQPGWLPQNPVSVSLETAQQRPFVETTAQQVESSVESDAPPYQSRHVVAPSASTSHRRQSPSARATILSRPNQQKGGNVLVERHTERETQSRQGVQTGRVPPARIGATKPKAVTTSGTHQRRPAVKVVQ